MDQINFLQKVFEKSWEYVKEVCTCFVDLEEAYDRLSKDKLWALVLEYDVRGQLLAAIKSLYQQSEVCVCVNDMKTKLFNVSLGLRQGCVLSPLLFIIYMDKRRDSSSSLASYLGSVMFGACCLQMTLHC